MNISLVLQFLYPTAIPLNDYIIFDANDGKGQFISFWNKNLGPQPTTDFLTQTANSAAYLAWLPSHGGDPSQTAAIPAKNLFGTTTDPTAIALQAVIIALAAEIKLASQPGYIPTSIATLITNASNAVTTVVNQGPVVTTNTPGLI